MDTNKMREQFEKWALGHFVNLFGEDILEKDFGGDYVQHNVRMAWAGWKNSREAVSVDLPAVTEACGMRYWTERQVITAVEAQGLKVAP